MYNKGFKATVADINENYFKNSEVKLRSISKVLILMKSDIIEALLHIRNIFKHHNGLDKKALVQYIPEVGKTVDAIIAAENQLECYEIFKAFYNEVLIKIGTEMFLNDVRDYSIATYIREKYEPYPANYVNIFNNFSTTRKSLNVFYDTITEYTVSRNYFTDIRGAWRKENCRLKSYCYFPLKNDIEGAEVIGDKVLFGTASDCRFSTDFDIGVVDFRNNLFFAKNCENVNLHPRDEFYRVNTHVSKGSPLIVTIAAPRVNYEFLEFLSMYLVDIDVYYDADNDIMSFVGLTTRERKISPDVLFNLISKVINNTEPEYIYHVDGEENDDIIFRSTYLTADAALNIVNKNEARLKIINDNIYKAMTENTQEDNRRPLIPFNPGQLGLVLVSGDIDGLVDEGNGHFHAIKGSTIRTMEQTESDDEDTYSKINTTITKVAALLPDGTVLDLH